MQMKDKANGIGDRSSTLLWCFISPPPLNHRVGRAAGIRTTKTRAVMMEKKPAATKNGSPAQTPPSSTPLRRAPNRIGLDNIKPVYSSTASDVLTMARWCDSTSELSRLRIAEENPLPKAKTTRPGRAC